MGVDAPGRAAAHSGTDSLSLIELLEAALEASPSGYQPGGALASRYSL